MGFFGLDALPLFVGLRFIAFLFVLSLDVVGAVEFLLMVLNLEQRRNADSEVVLLLWSKVIILLFLHATNMDLLGEHGKFK